jgi:hypothetical protein
MICARSFEYADGGGMQRKYFAYSLIRPSSHCAIIWIVIVCFFLGIVNIFVSMHTYIDGGLRQLHDETLCFQYTYVLVHTMYIQRHYTWASESASLPNNLNRSYIHTYIHRTSHNRSTLRTPHRNPHRSQPPSDGYPWRMHVRIYVSFARRSGGQVISID